MTGVPSPEILTTPFGANDSNRTEFPQDYYYDRITIANGLPSAYSAPTANGGVKFTRHDMNQLGYLATQSAYLNQCGYAYEWNRTVCNAIGGYPKGAILRDIVWDSTNSYPLEVLEIISLKDNNYVEPTNVELGISVSETSGTTTAVSTSWAVIDRRKNYNFFPDYTSRSLVWNGSYTSKTFISSSTLGGEGPYWYYIERTIENWDSLTTQQKTANTPSVRVVATLDSSLGNQQLVKSISGCEGQLVGALLPLVSFYVNIQYPDTAIVSGELDVNVYRFGMITETN